MLVSRVPKGDCFLASILISAGILPGIRQDMPSDEDKDIWTTQAPVLNKLRQQMSSVIFRIQQVTTEAGTWGGDIELAVSVWIREVQIR